MSAELVAASDAYQAALARVSQVAAELADAQTVIPAARAQLAAAIVAAHRTGTRVGEVARITGYSREQVRRILRAGGIKPTPAE